MTLTEYYNDVFSQLYCNQDKNTEHVCYLYTEKQIISNLSYFTKCYNDNLSAYKALLFFHEYLNGDYEI